MGSLRVVMCRPVIFHSEGIKNLLENYESDGNIMALVIFHLIFSQVGHVV